MATAAVGPQCTAVKTICAYSSRGGGKGEQKALVDAALSAVRAVANVVVWDPLGFAQNVASTLYNLVKVLEGKSKKVPLRSTEKLEVVCELEGGKLTSSSS